MTDRGGIVIGWVFKVGVEDCAVVFVGGNGLEIDELAVRFHACYMITMIPILRETQNMKRCGKFVWFVDKCLRKVGKLRIHLGHV